MMKESDRVVELKIDAISEKGHGLSWLAIAENVPTRVEIPFTIPGDVVKAYIVGKRGDKLLAKLIEVIAPSVNRVEARCKHFGTCGGCRLQHFSYEDQLKHKESFVRKCFEDVLNPSVDFRNILPSSTHWRYRNKMDYTFSKDFQNNTKLGLVAEGSRSHVLELDECYLSTPWFLDAVNAVKKWWDQTLANDSHLKQDIGLLRTLTLREGMRTGDRMAVLTVSGSPDLELQAKQLEGFVTALKNAITPQNSSSKLSVFVRMQQVGRGLVTSMYEMLLYGPGFIREILNIKFDDQDESTPLHFEIGPSTFFQPNPIQTEQFYSKALKMANIPKDAVVYDLYCGAGTIGLSIAKYVKQVVGIELSPESALNAINNAKRNGCKNVTILSGAVRYVLQQIPERKIPGPDIVIVNPPRSGLDPNAIEHLLALNAPKILYISCNPASQKQNIISLQQNGYHLTAVQPVDQFPQTYQVENIAILEKKI
jgi:23S rRNA (uracil1939-C5)-methyltransferase